MKARDLMKLLSRSVPAPQALKVLDDDMQCDIIKIGNILRNKRALRAFRQYQARPIPIPYEKKRQLQRPRKQMDSQEDKSNSKIDVAAMAASLKSKMKNMNPQTATQQANGVDAYLATPSSSKKQEISNGEQSGEKKIMKEIDAEIVPSIFYGDLLNPSS